MVSKNSHLVQMYFWNEVLARTTYTHLVWKSHSQHCICDLNWVGFHGCIVWDTECAEIVNDSSTQVQLPQLTLSLQYVWAAQVGSPLVLPEPGSVSEGTTEALTASHMQTASSLPRTLSHVCMLPPQCQDTWIGTLPLCHPFPKLNKWSKHTYSSTCVAFRT